MNTNVWTRSVSSEFFFVQKETFIVGQFDNHGSNCTEP